MGVAVLRAHGHGAQGGNIHPHSFYTAWRFLDQSFLSERSRRFFFSRAALALAGVCKHTSLAVIIVVTSRRFCAATISSTYSSAVGEKGTHLWQQLVQKGC